MVDTHKTPPPGPTRTIAQPLLPFVRPRRRASSRLRWSPLSVAAIALVIVLLAPIASVVFSIWYNDNGTIAHLARTRLSDYVLNTVMLTAGVGLGVLIIGTVTAGLVVMCEFPGRRIFEWALILPLTMPAYVVAYAYTDLLAHPGIVQATLRDVTGWGPRDYWFPNVRSLGGAIMMFILVLSPYVYLLARNAFLNQSRSYFEVSRALGRGALGVFVTVSIPLARPALAGGVALALMETLADFGTVAHFSVQTFTTGIYRAWYSMDDLIAAGQLATMLLTAVLVIVVCERMARRQAKFHNARQNQPIARHQLTGWRARAACAACALPVALGFIVPVLTLVNLHIVDGHQLLSEKYLTLIWNSIVLSGLAACVAVACAFLVAYAARLTPSWLTFAAVRLGNIGYAVPGSVIAIGILTTMAALDLALDITLQAAFGISAGIILTGSLAALVFAYVIRFLSVALNTVEATFAKISPSIDAASRTLGATPTETLTRVHLPLMRGGLLTAGLLVFVDVMKELPATLLLRPFNFDTLAIQAYRLASDERLAQAATPSLVLVATGLIPVIILSRGIMRRRPS